MTAAAAPSLAFEALEAIAWSRLWSPVAQPDQFAAVWRAFGFPEDPDLRDVRFAGAFHTGMPAPPVPLLLHAALNRPGDGVRMDILRAMSHLGVRAGPHMLAPDHLAIACEILAAAIEADEPVVASGICRRYLLPWCDAAASGLAGDRDLEEIVGAFRTFAASFAEAGAEEPI